MCEDAMGRAARVMAPTTQQRWPAGEAGAKGAADSTPASNLREPLVSAEIIDLAAARRARFTAELERARAETDQLVEEIGGRAKLLKVLIDGTMLQGLNLLRGKHWRNPFPVWRLLLRRQRGRAKASKRRGDFNRPCPVTYQCRSQQKAFQLHAGGM